MSDDDIDLFSEIENDETVEEKKEVKQKEEETKTEKFLDVADKPKEIIPEEKTTQTQTRVNPISDGNSPYDSLNEDQKIVLQDIATNLELDVHEIITEFNKAYEDGSLRMFPSDKKFTLAKAMAKQVLDEKAKIKKYTIMPLGKNVFYSKNSNQAIATLIAIVAFEREGKMVKARKAIRTFDKKGEKNYQALNNCHEFYTYETQLSLGKKESFSLTEFTQFEIGEPPSGKMASLSDLELYKKMGIIAQENYKKAGYSKIPENEKYPDPTDLKAVFVISNAPSRYKAPADFEDLESMSSLAIDFEGNPLTLYYPPFTIYKTMFDGSNPDQKTTGVAVGVLQEGKNGDFMSVFKFITFDDQY